MRSLWSNGFLGNMNGFRGNRMHAEMNPTRRLTHHRDETLLRRAQQEIARQ